MNRSQRHIRKVLDSVRHHSTRKLADPKAGPTAIDQLLARTQAALRDAYRESALPDGYPTSTPGAGTPGSGKNARRLMAVPADEQPADGGPPSVDLLPTSSTEAAAFAALEGQPDPVAAAGDRILTALTDVDKALELLARRLDAWDRLRSVTGVADPEMCYLATRYELAHDVAWTVGPKGGDLTATDFATALDPPWPVARRVCGFVYRFVWNHRRLPTADEMRLYAERGVVRMPEGSPRR